MRVLLIFFSLIIIAAFVTPYWFGVEAEKTYKNIQQELSESGNVDVIKRKYNRGWFYSDAETALRIQVGAKNLAYLVLHDSINHGPIPIKELLSGNFQLKPVQAIINSTIKIIPGTGNELTDFLAELLTAQIKTTVELKGNGESLISMPSFAHQSEEGNDSINWEGIYGSATFSPNFKETITDVKSPGLELTNDEFGLSIKKIEFDSNLRRHIPDLYTPIGNMNLNIELVSVENKKLRESYSIRELKLYVGAELMENNLVARSTLAFENFNVGATNYGSGYYKATISNIDPSALEKLEKTLKEIQESDTTDEMQRDILFSKITDILPDLIKNSPEIELTQLSLKTNKGEVSGRLKVAIDGSNPEVAKIPFLLLTSIKAEAGFTIPESLAESILQGLARKKLLEKAENMDYELPDDEEINELVKSAVSEQIKRLLEQKILILEGSDFKLNASYRNGVFKLNGQEMETPFSG